MRMTIPTLTAALALAVALVACAGEAPEEAPAEAEQTEKFVPDSTILREVRTSLQADPRLDDPEVSIEVHVDQGTVTLVGQVPSRFEMSIALEDAQSVLGVRRVFLDSLTVLSEDPGAVETETGT